MARATSCELLLMRVVPPISLIEPMGGVAEGVPDLWRNYDGQPKLARRYLEDVAGRLFKANLQIDFSIAEGEPAEAILKYVSEHPEIKAIAMSTHGRSGWSRWLFGSVAERVLHGSPVPLLLLRPGENHMRVDLEHTVVPRYSKLLVPLDGSQLAEQVLPHAISLARRMGGRLVLTSVTSTPFDLKVVKSDVYGEWSTVPWDTPAERNVRYLDSIAEKLTCDGMLVQGRVTCGS
jgi:nucleotide-binding universal stress UspA family protein